MVHRLSGRSPGPALYDLASFLWQARAGFSHELRSELAAVYLESVQRYHHWDADEFNYRLSLFALFRTLQVLGAYGLRGLHEQKPHFIESIFPALNNLKSLSIGLERDFRHCQPLRRRYLNVLFSASRQKLTG